eukprot:3113766-Prymnesium_polylepis.1
MQQARVPDRSERACRTSSAASDTQTVVSAAVSMTIVSDVGGLPDVGDRALCSAQCRAQRGFSKILAADVGGRVQSGASSQAVTTASAAS